MAVKFARPHLGVWTKPLVATLALLGATLAFNVYQGERANTVVSPAVRAELQQQGVANIEVVMGFTPERFNTAFLQNHGSLTGIHDGTATLLGASEADVNAIAHQYWVKRIRVVQ